MADHKFTNEEFRKCVECCTKVKTLGDCSEVGCPALRKHGCHFYLRTDDDGEHAVCDEMLKEAIDQLDRQKAEVAREIFEEIEEMCIDVFGNFHHIVFSELKKKYTEENG